MPRRVLWLTVVVVSLIGLSADSLADPVTPDRIVSGHPVLLSDQSGFIRAELTDSNTQFRPVEESRLQIDYADPYLSPAPDPNYFRGAVTAASRAAAESVLVVPEPAVIMLLGTGLIITASRIRKGKRSR